MEAGGPCFLVPSGTCRVASQRRRVLTPSPAEARRGPPVRIVRRGGRGQAWPGRGGPTLTAFRVRVPDGTELCRLCHTCLTRLEECPARSVRARPSPSRVGGSSGQGWPGPPGRRLWTARGRSGCVAVRHCQQRPPAGPHGRAAPAARGAREPRASQPARRRASPQTKHERPPRRFGNTLYAACSAVRGIPTSPRPAPPRRRPRAASAEAPRREAARGHPRLPAARGHRRGEMPRPCLLRGGHPLAGRGHQDSGWGARGLHAAVTLQCRDQRSGGGSDRGRPRLAAADRTRNKPARPARPARPLDCVRSTRPQRRAASEARPPHPHPVGAPWR